METAHDHHVVTLPGLRIRVGLMLAGLLWGSAAVSGQSGGIAVAVEGGVDLTAQGPGPVVEVRYEPGSGGPVVATFGVGGTFGVPGPNRCPTIAEPSAPCSPETSPPLLTFFFEPEVRYGGPGSRLRSSLGGRLSLVQGWDGGGPGVGLVAGMEGALSERWAVRTRLIADYLMVRTDPQAWRTLRIGLRLGLSVGT